MLYLKTFIGIIFQVTLIGLFLLLPAPNWYWPDAFIWLVFYFLLNLIPRFVYAPTIQRAWKQDWSLILKTNQKTTEWPPQ